MTPISQTIKVVILFDVSYSRQGTSHFSKAEQIIGDLGDGNQILKSLIEGNDEEISSSNLINEALNQGISSFTPDTIFEQMVQNFSLSKSIYGATLVRELTGHSISEIERNINIPEFQRELRSNIIKSYEKLRDSRFITDDGSITEIGSLSSAILMFMDELDKLIPIGILGDKINKRNFVYGDRESVKNFRKGDRYRDIALKSSIKSAIRRGHSVIEKEDMRSFQRQSRGSIYIVYAIDASSSMRGEKLCLSKKAGIALAYKAVELNDKVGLIVFGTEIVNAIAPTDDFTRILLSISGIKSGRETNFPLTINKAVELFPSENVTKHLILLTDAMPTVGKEPERETLEAVSQARYYGITVSIVGIRLNKNAEKFAKEIALIGDGRFYVVRDIKNLDLVVLDDYYNILSQKSL